MSIWFWKDKTVWKDEVEGIVPEEPAVSWARETTSLIVQFLDTRIHLIDNRMTGFFVCLVFLMSISNLCLPMNMWVFLFSTLWFWLILGLSGFAASTYPLSCLAHPSLNCFWYCEGETQATVIQGFLTEPLSRSLMFSRLLVWNLLCRVNTSMLCIFLFFFLVWLNTVLHFPRVDFVNF